MPRPVRLRVLVALAAGALPLFSPAIAAEPLRITQPVQATKFDVDPNRTYTSPSLVVDPEDSRTVFATLFEARSKRCGLMRSTDAGATWVRLDSTPSPPSYPYCFMSNATTQGRIAFGRHHTLYYLLDGWDLQDGENNRSVFLARSTDLGETWKTTVVSDARGKVGDQSESNKPVTGLAVDAKSASLDIVYVGWRRQSPGLSSPNEAPAQPMVSMSADGGETFSPPVSAVAGAFDSPQARAEPLKARSAPSATATAPPAGSRAAQPDSAVNFGGVNPRIVVDDKGTAYAMWIATTANLSPGPPLAHYLSRSTDHGKTWTASQINPFSKNIADSFEVQIAWSPEGGPDGTLHLVWEGTTQPEIAALSDIYYRRSTDAGKTWSDPKRIDDDDPKQFYINRIPDIRVAPNGRVDVVWWDTRDDPGITATDAYYAYSTDNGTTWSRNTRVSDRSVDRRIGPFAQNFDLWSPPGLVSTNAFALLAWEDTRNGNPVTQTQDIYSAVVQHEVLSVGASKVPRYLLAGVLGIVAAGLVFLALAYRRHPKPSADVVSARGPRTRVG
jgi:hypothetical protein